MDLLRNFSFLLTIVFFSLSSFSQDYKATNISLSQGLSQSSVYTISQDRSGFLWLGTQDGLNKYDGLNFTTYYNQPFDSTSISSGDITSILNDSHGRSWIGTGNYGLNLKINAEDKFIRFCATSPKEFPDNSIKCIYENSKGNILVSTMNDVCMISTPSNENTLYKFSFAKLKTETNSRAFEYVISICEKENDTYWFGTKTGLYLVQYKNKKATILAEHNEETGFKNGSILSLVKDKFGNCWAGSSNGIVVLNKENKIFRSINIALNSSGWDVIKSLCFSSDGALWIAASEGVYRVSPEEVRNIAINNPLPVRILPENRELSGELLSITEDKINKGLIWVGTLTNGLIKLSPVTKKFYTNHIESVTNNSFVSSLMQDHKNFLWIGTTSALLKFDKTKNKYSVYKHNKANPNSLPYNYISSITETKNNTIFLGSPTGLIKVINPWSDNPSFKKIIINPIAPDANIRHVFYDGNKLFIVLPRRVYSYDEYTNTSLEILRTSDSLRNISDFVLSSMAIDASGNLWLGSTNGLFYFKKNQSGFDTTHLKVFYHNQNDTSSLRSHTINDIKSDSDGSIWICTANGLSKVVIKNNSVSFLNYSTTNGLKNNMVYGALENHKDGTLWLSTNGGLTKFDPEKIVFTNYDLHDGLQSNEFNGGAYFKSHDNEFFFGGVNGYTSFYPDEIKSDTQSPATYITSFILQDSLIKLNPLLEKKIELNYDQNSFSINFIALHFIDPEKNTYEYMLDGFQKEWTKSGNSHVVNFSNLPAGEYIFKVKSANNDGISNGKPDSLQIIIRAPFWKTPWYYMLVATAILIFFWLLHLYRLRLKMEKIKEIEKIRKDIAADFHDELGHKLTTISWFSEILQTKLNPKEKELNTYLTKIKDTSGTLYHTMKDLLWAMDPAKDSVADLYLQIREFGESLFDQTGVEFTAVDPPKGLTESNIPLEYKRHVLLIFKEVMHNSFKHSKGSKVDLNILRENNHVVISLNDNGKGFNTGNAFIGYGLKNVEKRTQLINGKINIESCTTGTNFILELPLQN